MGSTCSGVIAMALSARSYAKIITNLNAGCISLSHNSKSAYQTRAENYLCGKVRRRQIVPGKDFRCTSSVKGMTGPYEAFDGIYSLWNRLLRKNIKQAPLSFGKSLFGIEQTNIKMYPVRVAVSCLYKQPGPAKKISVKI